MCILVAVPEYTLAVHLLFNEGGSCIVLYGAFFFEVAGTDYLGIPAYLLGTSCI